ncbi:Gamma-aminobutyraldehyde dehydrogenase [Streptomyces griseoloalbus]
MHKPGTTPQDRFPAAERFADGAQFIAGRPAKGTSGRTHSVVDPATGAQVYTYDLAGADDVDAAVAAAREAFPAWASATPGERSDALHRFATVVAERAEDFARAESLQCGKPLKLTREFDVPGTVDNIAFFAGAARHLAGQSAGEYSGDHTSYVRREPIGVVGSIAPWNYPLQMAAWKILPAIAAGNTIVLKPAELTPLTSLMFAQAAHDRRGPPGRGGQHRHRHRQGGRRAPGRPPRRGPDEASASPARTAVGKRVAEIVLHRHRTRPPSGARRQAPLRRLRRRRASTRAVHGASSRASLDRTRPGLQRPLITRATSSASLHSTRPSSRAPPRSTETVRAGRPRVPRSSRVRGPLAPTASASSRGRDEMKTTDGTTTAGGDVRLTGITKSYGDFTAVHPLDLTVPQGSFFALLGASGCGKTTTLRMIAGLEEPTAGTVHLGDQDVTALPPYKRPVNTVFQSYALFPHLDIYENVAFGLRRRGIKSVKKQVEEMLELVQLGEQARKKPHQLSGGQQQRVAVARALINHPKVLLLDEPLGALDLKLRRQMQLELKRIQTEVGITFVHVTHDQEEAMTMADCVAVMNAGRVEQLGTPADLYENPRTTFVANFLGTSNFIEAEVDSASGSEIVLKAGGGTLVLPEARNSAPARTGGKVLLGVRPEKISLTHADEAGEIPEGRNRITGRIAHSSFIGVSTQYVIDSPVCTAFEVYVQNIDRDPRLVPGAEVVLHWNPDHTFGLDAAQSLLAGTVGSAGVGTAGEEVA